MENVRDVANARRFRGHLRDVITRVAGDDLRAVLLFGSRARGDSRPDSDWDVAVLVGERADMSTLRDSISRATTAFDPDLEEQHVQTVILRPSDMSACGSLVLNLEAEAVAL